MNGLSTLMSHVPKPVLCLPTYVQELSYWNDFIYCYSYTIVFYFVILNMVKKYPKGDPLQLHLWVIQFDLFFNLT